MTTRALSPRSGRIVVGIAAALALVAGAAGCSSSPSRKPEPSHDVTQLTATLVSPVDITLKWKGRAPDAVGRIVEFATEQRGRYTILGFLPMSETTYRHPDLIPETPFYYRVRPYYGPASDPVSVTLPTGRSGKKEQAETDDWAEPRVLSGNQVKAAAQRPIRNLDRGHEKAATPTGLKATVMRADGIRFTWTDHAGDEEGYLLEVRPEGRPGYHVVAVLDPDVNSFGLITLPEERKASYRVRAFYYGKRSNVVHRTTGKAP